jgi:YrbI family 3-deoxy-D-manno-octulosonate 8-phosphate phosphatase
MHSPAAWAIIPARGGSKGIKGKNLQVVGGRSLLARAVAAAKAADWIERCIVSTDDADIAREARRAGAEVVDRPPHLAGDQASSEAALLHALDALALSGAALPEFLAFVQCTSPFILPADIDGTLQALLEQSADAAFTAVKFHGFLWQQMDGAKPLGHDAAGRPRRQDMAPTFRETGAVYAMRVAGFRKAGHRFFGKLAIYEVPGSRALEIDDAHDLQLARMLARQPEPAGARVPADLQGLVLDFDGVLTDNRVIVQENGDEAVLCSRADGLGIERALAAGIRIAVLSKEKNRVVAARCAKLGIGCVQACDDKLAAFRELLSSWQIAAGRVAYVGNDINDLACIAAAGLGVAVSDSAAPVLEAADLILEAKGGQGAVRELCDLVLEARRGRADPPPA